MRKILISGFVFVLMLGIGFIAVEFLHAQTGTPSVPNLEQVKANSACQAELKWMQQNQADYFVMSVDGLGGQELGSINCASGPCTNLTYRDNYLTPGSTYSYRLAAGRRSGGLSAYSAPAKSVTLPAVQTPSAPENLSNVWTDADRQTKVSWNVMNGLENGGYRVWHKAPTDPDYVPVTLIADKAMSFYQNFFSPSTPHYFKIESYNTGAGCDTSGITTSTNGIAKFSNFSTVLIIPAIPSNLRDVVAPNASNPSNWDVTFKWDAASQATKYELVYSLSQSFSSPTTVSVTTNEYRVPDAISGNVKLYWKVRALNDTNNNGTSPFVSSATSVGLPAPTNMRAQYSFNRVSPPAGNIAATLTWTDNATLMPRTAEIFESVGSDNNFGATPKYTITGTTIPYRPPAQTYALNLTQGSVYYYKVRIKYQPPSGSVIYSDFSSIANVNLMPVVKDVIFSGRAWSAYRAAVGDPIGVGWISFNEGETGEPIFADKEGLIGGRAWAAVKDMATNKYEYGWLSFNDSDLSGCPSGACSARYASSTGVISGWARFRGLTENRTPNDWDGWLSLRGTSYGTCYGSSNPKVKVDGTNFSKVDIMLGQTCANDGTFIPAGNPNLSGLMWGGSSVGGWFAFMASSTDPGGISIVPEGPVRVAIFERVDFTATMNARWYVGVASSTAVLKGNSTFGNMSLSTTTAGEATVYSAPNTSRKVYVFASSSVAQASVEVNVGAPYQLVGCTSDATSTIQIEWQKKYGSMHPELYTSYAPHTVKLFWGSTPGNVSNSLGSVSANDGVYVHTGLSTSTDYYYQLETTYTSGFTTTTSVFGACHTYEPPVGSDRPSRTKAFGASPSVIYVNWKDNTTTTKPYYFEIQKMKLTPATSTNFAATSTKAEYVRFEYKNNTTSTPYYHELQRATTTDSFRPVNPSPLPVKIEVTGWSGVRPPTASDYLQMKSYSDGSVTEATTYYYRMRSCSTIDASGNYVPVGQLKAGGTERQKPICSKFAAITGPGKVDDTTVSTTTLPKAPSNMSATSTSSSTITLVWRDNSKRESGFEIRRTGGSFGVATTTIGANTDILNTTTTYTDVNLQSDTQYTYTVRSFYDIPSGPDAGQRIYSDPVFASAHTYFEIHVAVSPWSGGSVDGNGISCPSGCYNTYPKGTLVTLVAGENAGYEWDSWSDGNTSMSRIVSGNSSVTAQFRRIMYTLSVSVNGNGKASGPGISCPGDCSQDIPWGTSVSLSASANGTSTFLGWSGCGAATSTCSFTMYSNRDVTASFTGSGIVSRAMKNLYAGIHNAAEVVYKTLFTKMSVNKGSVAAEKTAGLFSVIKNFIATFTQKINEFGAKVKDVAEYARKITEQSIVENTQVAHGGPVDPKALNLDFYFALGDASTTVPMYKDKDLDVDSVYLYRVRAAYEDGRANPFTEWDLLGAAKTLRDNGGGQTPQSRSVCSRNSYCDYSIPGFKSSSVLGVVPPIEESEQQCSTNSDCRDVGRGGQIYQER